MLLDWVAVELGEGYLLDASIIVCGWGESDGDLDRADRGDEGDGVADSSERGEEGGKEGLRSGESMATCVGACVVCKRQMNWGVETPRWYQVPQGGRREWLAGRSRAVALSL